MDINNVVLAGRLTKDPDMRYTPSGTAVTRFTVATNRPFKNAQGDREADFVNVAAWRKGGEAVANYFKKGDEIGVTGRLQSGSYEGQDGKRVYTTELIMENFSFGQKNNANRNENNSNNGAAGNTHSRPEQDPFNSGSGPIEVSDQDLPF